MLVRDNILGWFLKMTEYLSPFTFNFGQGQYTGMVFENDKNLSPFTFNVGQGHKYWDGF